MRCERFASLIVVTGIVLEGSSDEPTTTSTESNAVSQPKSDLPEGLKFRYEKNEVKVRASDRK